MSKTKAEKNNTLLIPLNPNGKEKAELIERAIRLTWDSLQSHLVGTYEVTSTSKKYIDEVGDEEFNQTCVKDYAETIFILSKLYDENEQAKDIIVRPGNKS